MTFKSLRRVAWSVSVCASLVACGVVAAQGAPPPRLTVPKLLELDERLRVPDDVFLAWMGDGKSYVAAQKSPDDSRVLVQWEVEGAHPWKPEEPRLLIDAVALERAGAAVESIGSEAARAIAKRANAELSTERDGALVDADDTLAFSLAHGTLLAVHADDLFAFDTRAGRAARLTADSAAEIAPTLSPDGTQVAFVRANDLYVVPAAGGKERALTQDGGATRLNGRLDWVYQEEIYGRGNFQGFWWSPDSKRIAFLVLDESAVPKHTIVEHGATHAEVEVLPYPRPGDPNPTAMVAVVELARGETRTLDLSAWQDPELLVVRVGWTPDWRDLWVMLQDRRQTWLDLCLADPATGAVRRVLRDQTPAWIEPMDGGPRWLEGGKRFLWLSERDGYRHLYLYGRDGALERRLTQGEWEVERLHGCDETAGVVWFDSDLADSKGRKLYRVGLVGGAPVAVTERPGVHAVAMSPDHAFFVDRWSSRSSFGRAVLCRANGEELRALFEADAELAREHGVVAPKYVTFPARDGVPLEALLYEPDGFDPARKYPVVSFCYGGPGASKVRDANLGRDGLFHRMLAQEGYLVWVCDNRSASGKGLAWAKGVYKDFGTRELADLEDGIDWLVAQGSADPSRVALWGWSFGGYLTAFALTHSTRFALGIAGAPVTDWRLYDSIYTERYMGLPAENPEGYARSSVIEAAGALWGRLLLIHGTRDENVHVGNTLQLAEALQKAGKGFDLMLYPGNRHRINDPAQRRHLYETMADYIRKRL